MTRRHDFDPEGQRLPVKLEPVSNGEFVPPALTKLQRRARRLAHEAASVHARDLGIDRRTFLISAAGAASTLLACNRAAHEAGARGGRFAVPEEAARDQELARATLLGDEFIFDVQTHCVDPKGRWLEGTAGERWRRNLTQVFPQAEKCAQDRFECFSAQVMAKEVFLDSDTDAAVVSALWGQPTPTPVDYAAEAREVVAAIGDGARALIHGGVFPQEPGEIEAMDEMVERYGVAAFKLYPQYGSNGRGIWLTDESALRMFDRARKLGVKTIAVHKGVSLPGLEPEYASPREMGEVARAQPDLTFLIYHSAFESTVVEGPYDPNRAQGVDRLIKAHQDAGFAPNQGNLYAELGSTWRHFMTRPTEAAHVLGKLLRYFGEDRILWGTDAIWYGSPQDQIQAFRTFEISSEFQERYGYPALTAQAKRKIFGLNGARVYGLDVTALRTGELPSRRAEYRLDPNPSFATFGPKTRREFMSLWKARAGRPG